MSTLNLNPNDHRPRLSYTGNAYDPDNAPLCRVDCDACGQTSYFGPSADWTDCPYCASRDDTKRDALAAKQAEREVERVADQVARACDESNRSGEPIDMSDYNERVSIEESVKAHTPWCVGNDGIEFRAAVTDRAFELLLERGNAVERAC